MEDSAIERAAELLLAAWRDGKRLAGLPDELTPGSFDDAYAIQDQLALGLGRVAGYKIAYTNPVVQKRFGVSEPLFGRLFHERILPSPATLELRGPLIGPAVEAEIGFRMDADLPRAGAPFTLANVADAVAVVCPAIEVANSRFERWDRIGPLLSVADNALGSHGITGAESTSLDAAELRQLRVVSSVDGVVHSEGQGTAVLGGPLEALTWLANALAARGRGLVAGEWVTTGCIPEVVRPEPGQRVHADFDRLGSVSVQF